MRHTLPSFLRTRVTQLLCTFAVIAIGRVNDRWAGRPRLKQRNSHDHGPDAAILWHGDGGSGVGTAWAWSDRPALNPSSLR